MNTKFAVLAATLATLFGSLDANAAPTLPACTKSWQAPVNGNWNDGARWSGGTVPGKADVVCIEVVGTYVVTLAGAKVGVGALRVGGESGRQTLMLYGDCPGDAKLTVNGPAAIASNGRLTLSSSECRRDAVLEVTSPSRLTNAGSIVVRVGGGGQRFMRADLTNTGSIALDASTIFDGAGAEWLNFGSLSIASRVQLLLPHGQRFTNGKLGSVAGQSSSTVAVYSGTFGHRDGTFSGSLTIELVDSNLNLTGTSPASYRWLGSGNLTGNVASGQSIDVVGTCSTSARLSSAAGFTNNGTFTLTSENPNPASGACLTNADVTIETPMLVNNHVLREKVAVGGNRTIVGTLVNSGEVEANNAEFFQVNGNYTQSSTGTLVSKARLPFSWGTIHVSGDATLDGTINFDRQTPDLPVYVGHPIVYAAHVGGAWSRVIGAFISSNGPAEVTYFRPNYENHESVSQGYAQLVVDTATFWATPGFGPPGAGFRVSGNGWPHESPVDVMMPDASGTPTLVGTVTTDADGGFNTASAVLTVPAWAPMGATTMTATSGLVGISLSSNFIVQ